MIHPHAGAKHAEYLAIAIALLAIFTSWLDTGILNVGLPILAHSFHTTPAGAAATVTAYAMAVALSILPLGFIADRIGLVRMTGLGFGCFAIATFGCALSSSIGELVGFRVFAGLSAAMLGVGAPAFVTRYVGPGLRHSAFAALSATVSVAFILGPALGGIILSFESWPWLFWINLPLCAEGLALTLYAHRLRLPELHDSHNSTSSGAKLTEALAPFASVVSLGATSIVAFITTAFELAPHFQPWEIGLALLCGPAGAVLMARTAAQMMGRGKHAKAMAIGTAVVAAASAALIAVPPRAIVIMGALLLVYGAGNGLTSAPTTASMLALFPASRHATASGLARTINAIAIATAASGTGILIARAGPGGAWLCSSALALSVSAIIVVSQARIQTSRPLQIDEQPRHAL